MWRDNKEHQLMMNRSEEKLMESMVKWGDYKSRHHERALMWVDRNSIVYNNNSRAWKNRSSIQQKFNINKSFQLDEEKFLNIEDDSSESDDKEPKLRESTMSKPFGYLSLDNRKTKYTNRKLYDIANDHDVILSTSFSKETYGKDDSFFTSKKKIDYDDVSPKKIQNETNIQILPHLWK